MFQFPYLRVSLTICYDGIFSMCTCFASEVKSKKLMSVCLRCPVRGEGWCQLIAGQDRGANITDTPVERDGGASQSVKHEGNHSMGTHTCTQGNEGKRARVRSQFTSGPSNIDGTPSFGQKNQDKTSQANAMVKYLNMESRHVAPSPAPF